MSYTQRPAPATPPEKGSFPLDHFNECAESKNVYMACLKEKRMKGYECREQAAAYLKCRMDRGLMTEEDLKSLGFFKQQQQK